MTDANAHNYPDIFGYITEAERHNVGDVQVALATRPRTVKAGRQFEVIMLIQNTVDSPVDVTVSLQLPNKDHDGKKGRFLTGKERLVVGVEPAEVGYVTLPMSTMPDTAVGTDYMIGMDVSARTLEKGERIRSVAGGATFDPSSVPPEKAEHIDDIKKLRFSTQKRGFLRGNTLETPISVMQGKIGQRPDMTPGWNSLWTLEDQDDLNLLLDKYGTLIRQRLLPRLVPEKLFEPLAKKTFVGFKRSGYPLTKPETICATRLLLVVLQYATGKNDGSAFGGSYDVMSYLRNRDRDRAKLEKRSFIAGDDAPVPELPRWLKAYLQLLTKDERMAAVPHKVIPELLYNELVLDALVYAFRIVEQASGENIGTEDEMENYAHLILDKLGTPGEMDFSHAYLPWIMGGILVADEVVIGEENLTDVMKDIRFMLEERKDEEDEANEPVFEMATTVLEQTLKKYGFLNNR
jgi:hypothetical protein